ncbi:MAG: DUF4175 family protein [Balneolaceae bacterium]|nr:DUF4175 family protein [Balneolaceae bacterium]
MSQQNPHSDSGGLEELQKMLRGAWERLRRKYLAASLLLTLLAPAAGFALLSLLESELWLPAWAKTTILVLAVAAAAAVAWLLMRRRKVTGFRAFYLDFCKARDLPVLRHALDLRLHDRADASPRLRETAIRANLKGLDRNQVRSELEAYLKASSNQRLLRRAGLGAGSSLALLLAAVLVFGSASGRALHFWKSYEQPNPYDYTVLPGDHTLEQGARLEPRVVFHGERPERVNLAFKTDVEQQYRSRPPSAGTGSSAAAAEAAGTGSAAGTAATASTAPDTLRFEGVPLQSDGSYYVEMDGFRSPLYQVDVQLRPRFESLTVTVRPPSYTGLDSTVYRYPFSRIEAIHGSELHIRGATNKPGTSIALRAAGETAGENADQARQRVQHKVQQPETSTAFEHAFTLTGADSLSFTIADANGLTNQNRFSFAVEPVDDRFPWAEITAPEGDPEMRTARPLDVTWEVGDDFGLQAATLDWELQKAFTDTPSSGSIPLDWNADRQSGTLTWDLTRLRPGPRDRLTFRIRVLDNDPYNGPKEGLSRTVTIRFPSVTESMEELSEQENDVEESLEKISEQNQQMQEEFDRFEQQLRENPQTNWEQRQSLDQMQKRREEMQQQVQELNRKFQELRQQMEQGSSVSPETRESYRELQRLMQEIDDPAFRQAMEELQKALDSMSQDRLREALENYEFNEELYSERIKRTLELFRSLKLNSNLDKLANTLEEMAKQEQELSQRDQTGREEVQRQEAIQEDMERLREEVDSLDQDAPEQAREQVDQLQQEEGARMDSLAAQVQENLEQMRAMQADSIATDSAGTGAAADSTAQGRQGSQAGQQGGQQGGSQQSGQQQGGQQPPGEGQQHIQQQQQQISQGMQQSADAMRSARQQMNQQGRQINMRGLQYVLFSLIDLSLNQEEVARETDQLANRSQAFVEQARTQRTIRQHFVQLSDSLFNLSTQIPGFSNSINKKKLEVERQLENAVTYLAERNKSNASFALRESLGGINDLATTLAQLLDQLSNSRSQSASMSMQQFMQQMQGMSQNQQQLNEQLQQMINDVAGDRLSQDQMERLNQLAQQQRQIREQLQQLQQSGVLEPGDEVLSEMERLSEQMEQSINDMRGGQTDANVSQRQQNILSRMLNAQQAVQERGKKEEREGSTAQEAPRATPPDVTLEELQKRIRSMLNDPQRTRFKQDYQQLIQRYFELLKEIEDN